MDKSGLGPLILHPPSAARAARPHPAPRTNRLMITTSEPVNNGPSRAPNIACARGDGATLLFLYPHLQNVDTGILVRVEVMTFRPPAS